MGTRGLRKCQQGYNEGANRRLTQAGGGGGVLHVVLLFEGQIKMRPGWSLDWVV